MNDKKIFSQNNQFLHGRKVKEINIGLPCFSNHITEVKYLISTKGKILYNKLYFRVVSYLNNGTFAR